MPRSDRNRRRVTTVSHDAGTDAGRTRNVNVADASNIVVSTNLGEPGSTHASSSRQTVRVRQHDGETHTWSETVEDDL